MVEKAIFAAGCFWHVQDTFSRLKGVISATSGYAGGNYKDPTYEIVCTGRTGHAESVLVEYDPSLISYDQLLEVFWDMHDPTTLNRQGPDRGTQYRSAIFYTTPEQKTKAESSRDRLQGSPEFKNRKIVTEIKPASEFYKAEDYHQNYLQKKGLAHCRI
ncbi:MAG: peptide-methionine (S)-S-oxide reductase MsrA [Thermoplasmata archaeon]|nr:peptide-methionine (S)-S-oxide reductase MsrA [Thermoplasmata archaeon]